MSENIAGKVAVITGASSGLGEATARHLAREGAALVLDPFFGNLDGAGRRAVVARVEAEHPTLFADVLKIVYLTYYEQPAVIAAIRAMGLGYNMTPLPDGYPVAPFDPARDTPRHRRGRWTRTEDVRRVDLSSVGITGAAAHGQA